MTTARGHRNDYNFRKFGGVEATLFAQHLEQRKAMSAHDFEVKRDDDQTP